MKNMSILLLSAVFLMNISCTKKLTVKSDTPEPVVIKGFFLDSAVEGLGYSSSKYKSGSTNKTGDFHCAQGDKIKFTIGSIVLGEALCGEILTPVELAVTGKSYTNYNELALSDKHKVGRIASLLQSLDSDGNQYNGISFKPDIIEKFEQKLSSPTQSVIVLDFSLDNLGLERPINEVIEEIKAELPSIANSIRVVEESEALKHFADYTLAKVERNELATSDIDLDGVIDTKDNCPEISNPEQRNNDQDNKGDLCDIDDDNDKI